MTTASPILRRFKAALKFSGALPPLDWAARGIRGQEENSARGIRGADKPPPQLPNSEAP